MPADHVQQYILLPDKGVRIDSGPATAATGQFFREIANVVSNTHAAGVHAPAVANGGAGAGAHGGGAAKFNYQITGTPGVKMRVLDSINEDGPKLVAMTQQEVSNLRAHEPGVRVVPLVYYSPALAPRPAVVQGPAVAGAGVNININITVVSKKGGAPIQGARVVAFTNFVNRSGDQKDTDATGRVSLNLGGASVKIERLYIYHDLGFWRYYKKNVTLTSGMTFKMVPIDVAYTDLLRLLYGTRALAAGKGVKVGVLDTGIAQHPDLVIDGGMNAVSGEDPTDFGDNGEGHGTHVAGIIAGRGTPPNGIRGVAPGVTLRSYRVFPKAPDEADSFAITRAILRAVQDECDLLNLSLEATQLDPSVMDAITDARSAGVLTFAAAGNDYRQGVSQPASSPNALAITAMGRKGTWPPGAGETEDVSSPFGTDPKNFIAVFSNDGPEVDLTGPGVGIISSFPGGYAVLDGTSMACPAMVGIAADILAARPDIMGMNRDLARAEAMQKAVLLSAHLLGFGPNFEGQGIL